MRPKEFLDGALPATNSIAVAALLRADALDDDQRLRHAVDRTVALAQPLLTRHPGALADLVAALPMLDRAPGDRRSPATGPTCSPRCAATGSPPPSWPGASPTTRRSSPTGPTASAFVCRGFACNAPADDAPTLAAQLEGLPR